MAHILRASQDRDLKEQQVDVEVGQPQVPSDSFLLRLLGGADKNVIVFDKSSEQILATLKGHSKKVTSVVFHPSQVCCCPLQAFPSCL